MDVLEKNQLARRDALVHWYYQSKNLLVKKWIINSGKNLEKSTLVDVGCGEGIFLELLSKDKKIRIKKFLGIDPAYPKKTFLSKKVKISPSIKKGKKYDFMLLMDVLEHLKNDSGFLQNIISYLSKSGELFITVPALKWMWSAHDKYLGHKRRYNYKSLMTLIKKTKRLKIKNLYYFYAPILPLVAIIRLCRQNKIPAKKSDMEKVSFFANKLLLKLAELESKVARKNKIAGLSLIAECQKK